jgi:uncharacterized membrane protein
MWHGKVAIIFAAIGVLDTLYLITEGEGAACGEYREFLGIPIDCGAVTLSVYSKIFGISISYFGLLFYLFIFGSILFKKNLDIDKTDIHTYLITLSPIGAFLFSIYLVIIQLFVLELICLYCMLSAATSTGIFLVLSVPKIKLLIENYTKSR